MKTRSSSIRRIGIMGGTFDPIHFGHLVAADEARSEFNLEKVIFVPTGAPPHKKGKRVADSEERYVMTLLATLDNDRFSISRMEVDRKGYSHTIDTLSELKSTFNGDNTEFFFITGLDAILDIMTWKEPDKLVSLCSFIAVTRPGYNPGDLSFLPGRISKFIHLLEIPMLAISSTEIRRRVAEGKSIRYLLPWPVEHYIHKRGLYSGEEVSRYEP